MSALLELIIVLEPASIPSVAIPVVVQTVIDCKAMESLAKVRNIH